MLIVWGQRLYGKVDAFGEQHAATRFFHIWFMPLIPLSSHWMLSEGDGAQCHAMRMSGKSVLAAYLRTWGLIGGAAIAGIGVAAGAPAAIVVGALGLVIGAASFRWSKARGRAAERAALLDGVLPTACDPLRIDRDFAARLKPHVDAHWAGLADGRTPGDLVERGDGTPAQRAVAFTLLRVVARAESGDVARRAREDSEKLLDAGIAVQGGSPYRDQLASP